jgi:hypothetical protein
MMKLKEAARALAFACALAAAGCGGEQPRSSAGTAQPAPTQGTAQTQTQSTRITSPLPDNAFKASLTPSEPPSKMRAGEKQVVTVHVKNVSQAAWPADGAPDGKFAVTLRDRWLSADGGKVVNDLDGGASLPHDVAPGGEVDMPLRITAPKEKGDYVLEFDMVQEQVNFFRDKGSTPARVNVHVE